MNIERLLAIDKPENSYFLFGSRQTGKTWLLKNTVNSDIYIDLLKRSEMLRYSANPEILYHEVDVIENPEPVIIIDEIQKLPILLDEIHRIIESIKGVKFILTGSSARKLKRSNVNLLGGRAITKYLYPFSYMEIKDIFNLNDYLKYGGIPNIYLASSEDVKTSLLKSYAETYLKEEIFDESLTRNLPAFTRFLDLAAHQNGKIINYSNISRETGVTSAVIKEYYSILEDTLLGFYIYPFTLSHRKRIVKHPKFYFNDTGIVNALKKMITADLTEGTQLYGNAFEHFIVLEVIKYIAYSEEEINVSFFRTSDGAEVDLILEKHGEIIPVEIKSSKNPVKTKGMSSFMSDHKTIKSFCVCKTPRAYKIDNILFIPWEDFIVKLYKGKMFI